MISGINRTWGDFNLRDLQQLLVDLLQGINTFL